MSNVRKVFGLLIVVAALLLAGCMQGQNQPSSNQSSSSQSGQAQGAPQIGTSGNQVNTSSPSNSSSSSQANDNGQAETSQNTAQQNFAPNSLAALALQHKMLHCTETITDAQGKQEKLDVYTYFDPKENTYYVAAYTNKSGKEEGYVIEKEWQKGQTVYTAVYLSLEAFGHLPGTMSSCVWIKEESNETIDYDYMDEYKENEADTSVDISAIQGSSTENVKCNTETYNVDLFKIEGKVCTQEEIMQNMGINYPS